MLKVLQVNGLFGKIKRPETHLVYCGTLNSNQYKTTLSPPFTEELSNLLMDENQFSWMRIGQAHDMFSRIFY